MKNIGYALEQIMVVGENIKYAEIKREIGLEQCVDFLRILLPIGGTFEDTISWETIESLIIKGN